MLTSCWLPPTVRVLWRSPVWARLRPSNIDASVGTLEELERIVGQIRSSWPVSSTASCPAREDDEGADGRGVHFFYARANRLISPRSKRALSQWYRHTAVQQIRPVALEELNSQRYWEKWDRVRTEDVRPPDRRLEP